MVETVASVSPGASRRFLRSVRLDRDLESPDSLAGYTITPQVQLLLRRLAQALESTSTDRAWTLTGPYGTGKSACALFMSHLVDPRGESRDQAWSILAEQAPAVLPELEDAVGNGMGLLPVALTLRRAPIASSLGEAMLGVLERLPGGPKRDGLAHAVRADLASPSPDTRRLLRRVEELGELARDSGPYRGLLIILDELGKGLEHAAFHAADDIYILQELAELAQRSGDRPLLVVGILHQSFDNYAARLDLLTRNEWGKVQGRFADIPFLEPPEQLIRLAGRAVAHLVGGGASPDLRATAERVAALLYEYGLGPRQVTALEFRPIATLAAPLHPLTLVALPYLFRRLGQNERSMFAYLSSQEAFGFRDLTEMTGERLVRLADLFDYCTANVGGLLAGQIVSRHWLEIVDALDRSPDLSELQVQVLKTVGLLGVLSEFSHLKPSREAVCLAVDDEPFSPRIGAALQELRRRSLITVRLLDRTYRIWQGSDIDVAEKVEEGRRRTGLRGVVGNTLRRYLPQRPIVARRHSYEWGAVRYFEVRYVSAIEDPRGIRPDGGANGVVVVCLPDDDSSAQAFHAWATDRSAGWPEPIVAVVPRQIRGLREAAAELRALNWVWENTPGLRDDRVARRELAERTVLAEQALGSLVELLLDPRPEPLGSAAAWYHRGERIDVRSLPMATQFLSEVLDGVYHASPRIHNELINRRSLSSAAAAARRTLVDRMLSQSGIELLGMTGYPPERSMYESVLLDSRLHRLDDGAWAFLPPPPDDPRRLSPVWDELRRVVFQPSAEPVAVDQLFARLEAPPFGVLAGVQPVLLAAFLLAYPDETSLYREGRFVPEPGIADFEVLMRRPELFAVAGTRVEGERVAVVERLARGLQTRPAIVPVVRGLVRSVRSLPETAWRTRHLSPATLAVRRVFEQAGSPERLLFRDLPSALGEAPFADDGAADPGRVEGFFERLNAALAEWSQFGPKQTAWARDTFLEAGGLPAGDAGWAALVERARALGDQSVHSSLVPLIRRLTTPGDERSAVESVLALVAGKPPKSWSDADVEQFPGRARELGERFRYAYEAHAPLDATEKNATDALVASLRDQLAQASPRVRRAALAALLAEISAETGGTRD